ncbi:hypothetical protein Tco_0268842 [Tanacetum coccineum]
MVRSRCWKVPPPGDNGTCAGAPRGREVRLLHPQPLRSVPGVIVEPPRLDAASVGSSEDADVVEVDSRLKRKRATGDDGAGPSKRVRHVSLGLSTSTEEEPRCVTTPWLFCKEVIETFLPPSVEATSDSSAPVTHAVQSPPQTSPKVFEGMPVDQLMEEFDMVTAQQAALVAQLRARFSNERSQSVQKDEEIMMLKTHWQNSLAEQSLRGLNARTFARKKKWPCLLKVAHKPWAAPCCHETFGNTQGGQAVPLGMFVEVCMGTCKAESGGENSMKKRLADSACRKNQRYHGYNDKAYEGTCCCDEAMKLLELPHIAQLERDLDYPIDVIMAGLTLARHASEGAEGQPDYFLKPDVAQLQVPIFSRPRDILNPFAFEREIPLKESLEAHAIRLAKKKGVKGKAILCGVGAAHIPRSDGVPVSVATVLPKDSELLGKLEEAGDAAYQVGRSEQGHCHSTPAPATSFSSSLC